MIGFFNNLAISKKLYGMAGVLLAFLTILGVVSISNLGAVNALGGSVYADRVVPLKDVSEVRALLGDIDSQVLRSFAASPVRRRLRRHRGPRQSRSTGLSVSTRRRRWSRRRRRACASSTSSGRHTATIPRIQEFGARGQLDEAGALYFAKAAPLYAKVDKSLADLSTINTDVAKQSNEQIASTYSSSRTLTIALLVIALVIGAGVAFAVATAIRKVVARVLVCLESLQDNDAADLRRRPRRDGRAAT